MFIFFFYARPFNYLDPFRSITHIQTNPFSIIRDLVFDIIKMGFKIFKNKTLCILLTSAKKKIIVKMCLKH